MNTRSKLIVFRQPGSLKNQGKWYICQNKACFIRFHTKSPSLYVYFKISLLVSISWSLGLCLSWSLDPCLPQSLCLCLSVCLSLSLSVFLCLDLSWSVLISLLENQRLHIKSEQHWSCFWCCLIWSAFLQPKISGHSYWFYHHHHAIYRTNYVCLQGEKIIYALISWFWFYI